MVITVSGDFSAGLFYFWGLRYRIFFDWDVEGRAASGKEDPFLFGSGLRDFEGGARCMEGYVLIDNGHLTEKEARLNMEQCADFLARMIQKYGPEILAELKEKDAKESGE